MNRELATVARRFADANNARMEDQPTSTFYADVVTVTPGAAWDGNAVVEVIWRGRTFPVAEYASSYTPVVGHRVTCHYIDNQVSIAYHGIGGHP